MKKINKLFIKRIIIIFGIIVIPLMYSYFYLKAFWDPYSNLDKLPVAIVNKDQGTTIDLKEKNIGKDLQKEMKKSNKLNFSFVSSEEAKKGLDNGKYYATIIIPEDFTKKISTAGEENKSTAQLIYSPNEKTNYLASQILSKAILELSDNVKTNIVGEVVDNLSTKLYEVPSKLSEINGGIFKLYDGSTQLNNGAVLLSEGISSLNTNYNPFNIGLNSLKLGMDNLYQGSNALDSGINKLSVGTNTLKDSTKELYKIDEAVKTLNLGTSNLNESSKTYVDGVQQYITQSNEIGEKIAEYVASNPSSLTDPNIQYIISILTDPETSQKVSDLTNGGEDLKGGIESINTNLSLISNKTSSLSELNTQIGSISLGMDTLKSGSNNLNSGIYSALNGITKISYSSNDIMSGINKINYSTKELSSGTNSIKNGIYQINNKINEGINNTNSDLKKLNGISQFSKEPITVKNSKINNVPNYGTSFAAYFMSLSLWVGGLIIFVGIYLDADERFKILSRHSNNKTLRTFIYLLIGIAQSILLAGSLRLFLKLTVVNIPMYYISCMLVSIVFISIIQFLIVNFKDLGKFLVILLLILQLTSCGGTFPMELVPDFFNKLFSFMPMTYSVSLFKETISGGNVSIINHNIFILSIILIGFISMTLIASKVRKTME